MNVTTDDGATIKFEGCAVDDPPQSERPRASEEGDRWFALSGAEIQSSVARTAAKTDKAARLAELIAWKGLGAYL